jgi:uncharacterized protein (TIGR03435 family)
MVEYTRRCSILKVCDLYVASPVACAAGVTGGELKKRTEGIMANRFTRKLNFGKKLLLAAAAAVAVAAPTVIGLMNPPQSRAQAQPAGTQNAAPPPAFEVASIKRSAVQAGSWLRFLPGGRLSATSWVKQLIQVAYGVEDYQVSGGPGWLTSDRYDIEAKAEKADAGRDEMTMMLRSLLADRFKLQLRQEAKRDFPVYGLVVDKNGPKLRPLKDGEVSRCGRDNSFMCGITTTAQLAKSLQYTVDRPVLDKTGLDGKFDVLLDFDTYSSRGQTPPPDYDKPSLASALQEQLGLRLQPQKESFPVLVVESIQRPTAN